jgi:hypothetical protein
VLLAVLAAVKFVTLLIEDDLDITRAPVAFLLPIVALLVGVFLTGRHRTVGVWTIAVVALILLAVFALAIVDRGIAQQNGSDALLVFAGTPIALAILIATPRALKQP